MGQEPELDANGVPVLTTKDWSLWARLCAAVIIATGLGVLTLGITKWGGYLIAVGAVFIVVGVLGIIVAYKENRQWAKVNALSRVSVFRYDFLLVLSYYYALVISTVTTILLLTKDISSVSEWVNDYCNENKLDDRTCTQERIIKWIFSIVGFIVCITGCCLCIFCASAYTHSFSEVWNREFEQTKVKKKNKNKKYHKGGPETTDPENPARSFLIN